jgi:CRISPR/Cas system Type II protein with McrA/HNH and RuvC-like nuclease domain
VSRKSLSKKIRFDVFKRDDFTCAYCGGKPPGSVLEIDHIEPVSKGGENDIDNLITACFDCNRGKSDRLLTSIPQNINEKAELQREKEEQLKEFKKLKAAIKRRITKDINKIEEVFETYYPDQLCDHMHKACLKCDSPSKVIKYFCGINWGVIKGRYQ